MAVSLTARTRLNGKVAKTPNLSTKPPYLVTLTRVPGNSESRISKLPPVMALILELVGEGLSHDQAVSDNCVRRQYGKR